MSNEISGDVSILFENCRVTSRHGTGIRVTKVSDDGPAGLIEFRNCTVENTQGYGIKVQDKSSLGARVRFVGCRLRRVAQHRSYQGAWTPVWLHLFRQAVTRRFGGIDFVDCSVEDDFERPAILFQQDEGDFGLFDVQGKLAVFNPHGVLTSLGDKRMSVELVVAPAEP